jgi:hypothetical protein
VNYRDPYIFLTRRPAPELSKWRVTRPHMGGTFEAEFSLRADGALLRRIRNDGSTWQPYEQFTPGGWTIDNTLTFLHGQYKNVILT